MSKSSSAGNQPIDESLEFIFTSILKQEEWSEAADFITSVGSDFLPSKTIIQSLIFEVLMKSNDASSLSKVSLYLTNIIKTYPPVNEEQRQFFYNAVREDRGYLSDLWSVLRHIVNSCFCHQKIYEAVEDDTRAPPLKYPNCKHLFDLYIKLFTVDFEHLSSDSSKSCLIMRLFWPDGNTSSSKRTECFYQWINDVYNIPSANQPPSLMENLHEMLTLLVKYLTEGQNPLSKDANYFNHPALATCAEDIVNFCKDAFSNLPNVKLFLSFTTIPSLQARVSEKIIRLIFKQSAKSFSVLTLKEIVNQYMFPPKFNKWKNSKASGYIEKNLRKRGEKSNDTNKKVERTKLHELCEENKFGDLMVALKTDYEDINTPDISGHTPLHKACEAGAYMSVKVLINEAGKGSVPKLDLVACDSEGQTPLHLAIKADFYQITQLMLLSAGSDLLIPRNNRGMQPSDLCTSAGMKKLLDSYNSELVAASSEVDAFVEGSQMKEAPPLKTFKEYSIYLHALCCLLCRYTEIAQLYKYIWKKTNLVKSHGSKQCCHYDYYNTACLEDTTLLLEMPELIDVFIQSIQKNASKLNINIDLEFLPLKGYKASIQPKK